MPARPFREELSEWGAGAVTSIPATNKLARNSSPRMRNAALIGHGVPVRRKGFRLLTQTGTGSPIRAVGDFKDIQWTISENGDWDKLSGGTLAAIDSGTATPFTSPVYFPSTAIANNLLFAVDGNVAYKTDGTTVSKFGIERPLRPTLTEVAEDPIAILGTDKVKITLSRTDADDFKAEVVVDDTKGAALSAEINPLDVPRPGSAAGDSIPAKTVRVILGTDADGVLDPTKNTATLAVTALDALPDVAAVAINGTTQPLTAAEGPIAFAAQSNPSGTYRVALSYVNANTGHESSRGAFSELTVAKRQFTVAYTAPSDAQVTHVKAHIFKVGLTGDFLELFPPNVTPLRDDFGWPIATTTLTVDLTDADINTLVVLSPDEHENDPPPAGTKAILYQGSRMFATDGDFLYYSKIGKPESFDPDNKEPVNPQDKYKIVTMVAIGDQHQLILKDGSSHVLIGPDDPNTWEIRELDPTVGAISPFVAQTKGATWWISNQGYMRLNVGERPQRLDQPAFDNQTDEHALNIVNLRHGVVGVDKRRQRVFFIVPTINSEQNDVIHVHNAKLGVWEDTWDPFDISAYGTLKDDTSLVGNYDGRLFRVWDGLEDGVRVDNGAGTAFTLKKTVTAVGDNTLTDSTANFDTTGDGLKGIPVIVVSSTYTIQRRIISSNTATVLTVSQDWHTNPTVGDTFYVGVPSFEFDTIALTPSGIPDRQGSPFDSRRFKRMLAKVLADEGNTPVLVQAIIDKEVAKNMTFTATTTVAQWDVDQWDVATWGEALDTREHQHIGKSGRTLTLRTVVREPSRQFILFDIGVMGTTFGYKE